MRRHSTTRRAVVRGVAAAGAVGLVAPTIAAPVSSDQRLFMLMREWNETEERYIAALEAADDVGNPPGPERDAAEAAADELREHLDDIQTSMAEIPADGPVGLWCKAELSVGPMVRGVASFEDDELARSLLEDLRRLARQMAA